MMNITEYLTDAAPGVRDSVSPQEVLDAILERRFGIGHDQDAYVRTRPECGTTMCVAGWAVFLAGYDMRSGATDSAWAYHPTTGHRVTVSQRAQELMKLTVREADILFYDTPKRYVPGMIAQIQQRQANEGVTF